MEYEQVHHRDLSATRFAFRDEDFGTSRWECCSEIAFAADGHAVGGIVVKHVDVGPW